MEPNVGMNNTCINQVKQDYAEHVFQDWIFFFKKSP